MAERTVDGTRFRRTLRTRVRRVGGVLHLALDDQDLVLDDTAEFLWFRLAVPVTVEELAGAVADEYGIGAEEVRSDVREVVEALVAGGFAQERSCR